ncbi:MAG TPA: hypothetical protein VFO03_11630 [Gaiellaceae bacterium]|jgi:hypothetical protein|nr:hypothetical protein [Gaiellaceae bacterium]
MATTISELTYELSVRSLTEQESSLNELRTRTGVLLAATAVAIALFGSRVLDDGSLFDLAGTGLALVSFLLSVFVVAPKHSFAFVVDAAAAHETFAREGVSVEDAHTALVYWNREVWEENQAVIDTLVRAFRWACVTLVGAVALWSIGLAIQ